MISNTTKTVCLWVYMYQHKRRGGIDFFLSRSLAPPVCASRNASFSRFSTARGIFSFDTDDGTVFFTFFFCCFLSFCTAARRKGAAAVGQQHTRSMATLKQIQMRLKSVTNIQKITQSMKMVSAAKYARAERELRQARPYGEGVMVSGRRRTTTDRPLDLLVAFSCRRSTTSPAPSKRPTPVMQTNWS